jgi:WD40 repeat protein
MTAVACLCGLALLAAPPFTAIAFTSEGTVLAGSQAGVEEFSWPALKPLRRLPIEMGQVHDLRFAPDGELLAVAGGRPGETGEVELLAWPSGEPMRRLADHGDLVYGVAWRSDGGRLATASWDGIVRIVNLGGGPAVTLQGHSRGVRAVSFLPGDAMVVTASADQSLRVWNAAAGELVRVLDNHTGPVHDLALRPDDDGGLPMAASAGADGTLRLWQPTIGRLVRFARLPSEPLSVAWLPGGERLLVSCRDGKARLIDAATAEMIAELPVIDGWAYSAAVSPDGRSAAIGGAGGQLRRIAFDP